MAVIGESLSDGMRDGWEPQCGVAVVSVRGINSDKDGMKEGLL